MSEFITFLNILLWILTIGGYVIFNLFQKNKKLEEAVIEYQQVFSSIQDLIETSNQVIESMEISKAFKSDDEAGAFFKAMEEIQRELNEYRKIQK